MASPKLRVNLKCIDLGHIGKGISIELKAPVPVVKIFDVSVRDVPGLSLGVSDTTGGCRGLLSKCNRWDRLMLLETYLLGW
jgi:hypothetical protein